MGDDQDVRVRREDIPQHLRLAGAHRRLDEVEPALDRGRCQVARRGLEVGLGRTVEGGEVVDRQHGILRPPRLLTDDAVDAFRGLVAVEDGERRMLLVGMVGAAEGHAILHRQVAQGCPLAAREPDRHVRVEPLLRDDGARSQPRLRILVVTLGDGDQFGERGMVESAAQDDRFTAGVAVEDAGGVLDAPVAVETDLQVEQRGLEFAPVGERARQGKDDAEAVDARRLLEVALGRVEDRAVALDEGIGQGVVDGHAAAVDVEREDIAGQEVVAVPVRPRLPGRLLSQLGRVFLHQLAGIGHAGLDVVGEFFGGDFDVLPALRIETFVFWPAIDNVRIERDFEQ